MNILIVTISWLLWVIFQRRWVCRYLCGFLIFFLSEISSEVGLLDHIVVLFLIFWRPSILFSIMTIPIYTPANCVQGFSFLCILAKLVICRHFYKTHPNRCEVVLHQKPLNGFDFHFSHDAWWEMIIIQMIFYPFKNKIESESEGRSVVSDLCDPMDYSPWNSPGQNTGVGSLSLLQGICPTQGSNPGLLHCRRILSQLSHKASPEQLKSVLLMWRSHAISPKRSAWGLVLGIKLFKSNPKFLPCKCILRAPGWW